MELCLVSVTENDFGCFGLVVRVINAFFGIKLAKKVSAEEKFYKNRLQFTTTQ